MENADGVHVHNGVQKTFHFIAYVLNGKGQLVELDGTKVGPVVIAEVRRAAVMNHAVEGVAAGRRRRPTPRPLHEALQSTRPASTAHIAEGVETALRDCCVPRVDAS